MKSGAYTYVNPAVDPNAGNRAAKFVQNMDFERFAATDAEMQGAEMLLQELEKIGVQGHLHSFSIPASEIQSVHLTSESGKEYEASGYALCGSTSPEGLKAPFFYAEDGNDIYLAQAKGCIVLLNNHPNVALYRKLVEARVAGFISISGSPLDKPEETDLELRALHPSRHYAEQDGVQIPGVTIRYTTAMDLLEESPDTVTIQISQHRKDQESHNVIAEIPGTEEGNDWLVFCAHYDTVRFSHGSYDNASGSAILLEVCRYFLQHPAKRPMRFIWFGAEEQGLLGSLAYVRDTAKEELEKIALVINIDLAGHLIGSHHAIVSAEEGLCDMLRFLAKEAGFGMEVTHDIFSSDSSSFADKNVPAMSFYRGGFGGHNRHDVAKWISARSLKSTIDFLILFSERLANCQVFPISRNIPDNIKQKLNTYFNRD